MNHDLLKDIDITIFGREEDTLRWFQNYLENSTGSFSRSVELFQKYYHKCFQDLIELKFDKDSRRLEYQFLTENDKDYTCNYINQQDIDHCIDNRYHIQILKILKNNSYLRDTCLEWNLISSKVMDRILSFSDLEIDSFTMEDVYSLFHDGVKKEGKCSLEEVQQLIFPLLKIHRLNNLQIKYAHTARVVYLTDYEIHKMNLSSSLVKDIILTSSLFHDVGRFYQGAFYNSFDDSTMKSMEGEGRGHAEAGYYYSLLDMIHLNTLGCQSSNDLVIHSIASFVVRRHQRSNQDNKSFDMVKAQMDLSTQVDSKLYQFIYDAYLNAEAFPDGIHSRFGRRIPHQQKYMKSRLDNIISTMKIVLEQYQKDPSKMDEILQNMEELLGRRIDDFFHKEPITEKGYYREEEVSILKTILSKEEFDSIYQDGKIEVSSSLTSKLKDYYLYIKSSSIFFLSKEEEELLKHFQFSEEEKEKYIIKKKMKYEDREGILRTPELNQILNEYKEYEFCKNQDLDFSHYQRLFSVAKNDLAKFAQFDISKSIEDIFEGRGKTLSKDEIDPDIQSVIDLSLNLVMDADKMDIFIQRVNKRWDNWNPKYITVRSDTSKKESFLDVLEHVYQIPITYQDGKVVFDSTLKRILFENRDTNSSFKRNLDSILDIDKEELSSMELEQLDEFLKKDYSLITKSSKIEADKNGVFRYDDTFINYLLNLTSKNPKIKEEFKKNQILIDFDLFGKEIPSILISILKENHIDLEEVNNRIKVSYEVMKEVFPKDDERIQKEMDLILPEDLRYRMFLEDQDREKIGNSKFPLGRRASNHPNFDWANIFPAIWWHIDQFIMTNMRSGESFQFIKDTNLLERLKNTYTSEECNPDFIHFIDEVIEYAKEFIDTASLLYIDSNNQIGFSSTLKEGERRLLMLDEGLMIQVRDEASRRWRKKKGKEQVNQMIFFSGIETNDEISISR